MSDQPKAETPAGAAPAAAARKSSKMMMRIIVLLFLVAVIGSECLIASLWIPSTSEAKPASSEPSEKPEKKEAKAAEHAKEGKAEGHKKEAKAEGHGKEAKEEGAKKESKEGHGKEKEKGEEKHAPAKSGEHKDGPTDPSEQMEVDLEQFSVTAHQPASNTTTRIEFHLIGAVAAGDKEEFEKLLAANRFRIREQVLVTVRSAEGADLADPGLGLIKRRILEKTNALLGKPLLRAVIVSDFSYLEQ
jgi:hypothetical protein